MVSTHQQAIKPATNPVTTATPPPTVQPLSTPTTGAGEMLASPMEAQIVDLTAPPAVQAAVADRAANLPVVDAAAADGNTRVESAQDPPPGLPVRSEPVVDV
ncbi:hypothetical protein As57867_006740, partial [Aphanomyces stellatus]